jgi:hypothetical protein
VAVVPGKDFGSDAHVRLSYATSDALISEGSRAWAPPSLAWRDRSAAAALEAAAAAEVTPGHRRGRHRQDHARHWARLRLPPPAARPSASWTPTSASRDVGPPTTVGLGRVRRPIERLKRPKSSALEFLGMTSPARCMRETGDATARLVARAAEAGCTRVLVDTSGLVEGSFGLALKAHQDRSRASRPDQSRSSERTSASRSSASTRTRSPSCACRPRRRASARRRSGDRRRQRALDAHLAGAVPVPLDLTRVPARPGRRARAAWPSSRCWVRLVGLDDREGRTRGLGWVSALASARHG